MATYTAAQLAALKAQLAAGITSAAYGDKRTEFRSLAELRELIAIIERDLAGTERVRQFRVTTASDRGL